MSLLWKGILIGLIFGVPVGAVGAMTVQRTWEHGIRAGLFTGMGSSVADCIYAGIGWLVVVGVFMGTYLWWGGLSAAVALARKKKRTGSFQKMNRIFGTVLSLFGILVFIRALPK